MPQESQYPCSPTDEIEGVLYLPRLAAKVRLMHARTLHPELHGNLGLGMDLWICQFLGVDYNDLKAQILAGATDEQALAWARENGVTRPDYEQAWFKAYLSKRGFRDDLSERLAQRKKEDPKTDRDDVLTFADYIDIDEGRSL